jgi:hypothetical protein
MTNIVFDNYINELRLSIVSIENSNLSENIYIGSYNHQGNPHGFGTMKYSNGEIYEGDWFDGVRSGVGKMTWTNGDVYEGEFLDSKKNGKGKYTWPSGDFYEGDWIDNNRANIGFQIKYNDRYILRENYIDGIPTGKGLITWKNGETYEGDFIPIYSDPCPHGFGTFKRGIILFIGEFKQGEFYGKGKEIWNGDGINCTKEGDFKNWELNGWGIETDHDTGKVVEGEFINGHLLVGGKVIIRFNVGDVFNGTVVSGDSVMHIANGILTYANGDVYKGDFHTGYIERCGKGVMEYANNEWYSGDWENDKYHGRGDKVFVNGSKYSGNWKNGKRNGKGELWWKNPDAYSDSMYEGEWKDDLYHGWGLLQIDGKIVYKGNWFNGKQC